MDMLSSIVIGSMILSVILLVWAIIKSVHQLED